MGRQLVLVVDDDRGVQDAMREELANREYEVVFAGDGDSAMRMIDARSPDVLVLDLQLPNVSGPMVAAKLNMLAARPQVLICSAVPYATEIASDVCADGLLLKPFVRADLRHEVERLLALRRH
ncbi:MAG: DNA-binding response regulator [Myxococcales bacterium]|nr:DNA-binding response regulator [Myxococcales bacterium]